MTEAGNLDLTKRIMEYLGQKPFFFYDILRHFKDEEYRDIFVAWSTIRSQKKFDRDEEGRYILKK